MNRFREKGLINYDYDGEIVVHVSLLNSVLQDHPQITKQMKIADGLGF